MGPDAIWDKMSAAALRLSDQYCKGDTLEVIADRRSTGLLTVSEGLAVRDDWTDVFEPIRQRRILRERWNDVQTLEQATESIEIFLRERPDQCPSGDDR